MPVELVPLAFFSLELADSAVVALNHHFAGEDVRVKPASAVTLPSSLGREAWIVAPRARARSTAAAAASERARDAAGPFGVGHVWGTQQLCGWGDEGARAGRRVPARRTSREAFRLPAKA